MVTARFTLVQVDFHQWLPRQVEMFEYRRRAHAALLVAFLVMVDLGRGPDVPDKDRMIGSSGHDLIDMLPGEQY